jgi:hypothetical protein
VSFDAEANSVTFSSSDGEVSATGDYADYVIFGEELKFPVDAAAAEMKTEYTLYGSPASGTFAAVTTVDDVEYEAELTLKNNTFSLVISGGEGPYEMNGAFEPGPTSAFVIEEGTNEGAEFTGVIACDAINLEIEVTMTLSIGFMFEKPAAEPVMPES